jgi:hypothetical protein
VSPNTTPTEQAVPTVAVYIGCLNNNGSAANFRAGTVKYADIGGPLTAAQEALRYQNVQLLIGSP